MKSSLPKKISPAVLILGDASLVSEYSEIALRSNYEIIPPAKIKNLRSIAEEISIALELSNINVEEKKKNLLLLDKALPPTTAILSSSVTITALEQSSWMAMKHRLIGIGALPTLINNSVVEVAPSFHTIGSTVDVTRKFFISIQKDVAIVQDRVGMVLPRILCQIINEAMFAVQQEVALPQDIDMAMKLGMNYPSGPIEWGEKIGFVQVCAVMEALHRDLGEERYRLCPLLKQLAVTGKFWR